MNDDFRQHLKDVKAKHVSTISKQYDLFYMFIALSVMYLFMYYFVANAFMYFIVTASISVYYFIRMVFTYRKIAEIDSISNSIRRD